MSDIIFFFIALGLIACGRHQLPDEDPNTGLDRVQLVLFAAPWCSECKSDLPEIQRRLNALAPGVRARINVTLYVTTSGNPAVPATQEDAQGYANALYLTVPTVPDPWRWQTFKKYIGGNLQLPAAAIMDGPKVLKSFRAGPTSFVPEEIVSAATSKLK